MRPDMLDVADAASVAEYERVFYAAFQRAKGNRLIRDIWRWNDANGRLATTIPYGDQIIYIRRNGLGAINSALGVNISMLDFQATSFGFAPQPNTDKWCELLTFFALEKSLSDRADFVWHCLSDLARQGFSVAYATTAARPLKSYTRYYGMQIIRSAVIKGEARHFIRYPLPPPPRNKPPQ
jgi:hypothetical protein